MPSSLVPSAAEVAQAAELYRVGAFTFTQLRNIARRAHSHSPDPDTRDIARRLLEAMR